MGQPAIPHPNDAHIFTGQCQLGLVCRGKGPRDGLLTLLADQWSPPLRCSNGRRDSIESCVACAADWKTIRPGSSVFRALPRAGAPQ